MRPVHELLREYMVWCSVFPLTWTGIWLFSPHVLLSDHNSSCLAATTEVQSVTIQFHSSHKAMSVTGNSITVQQLSSYGSEQNFPPTTLLVLINHLLHLILPVSPGYILTLISLT
jgi:hypothetical protein